MHLNKNGGGKALHRFSGSQGFVAAARAAWLVSPDKADAKRMLLLPIKNNLSADTGGLAFAVVSHGESSCLAWEIGAVEVSADDALQDDRQEQGDALRR